MNREFVLQKPVITERSLKLVDELNQYTFEIGPNATKKQVTEEVEKRFKVKVEKVRIIRIPGKRVVWGRKRIQGRKRDRKKAVVTLASSDSIDIFKVK